MYAERPLSTYYTTTLVLISGHQECKLAFAANASLHSSELLVKFIVVMYYIRTPLIVTRNQCVQFGNILNLFNGLFDGL